MSWVPASDPASGHPAPPRLVVWLALAICVAGTVMMLVGAWRVGVWTDEPTHVQRYENLLQHGWYLLDDDLVGDTPGAWVTDQYLGLAERESPLPPRLSRCSNEADLRLLTGRP